MKVTDSIFGKKVYINPVAIASSEGPAEPIPSMSTEPSTTTNLTSLSSK